MTPLRQQENNCIHYELCKGAWNGIPGGCIGKDDCKFYRTRTHTSTPALPDEICRICEDCRAKHDTAIRNATLDDLSTLIFMDNDHRSYISEIGRMVYEEGEIQNYIESLRTPKEQP
jgi:hypothetical protein